MFLKRFSLRLAMICTLRSSEFAPRLPIHRATGAILEGGFQAHKKIEALIDLAENGGVAAPTTKTSLATRVILVSQSSCNII